MIFYGIFFIFFLYIDNYVIYISPFPFLFFLVKITYTSLPQKKAFSLQICWLNFRCPALLTETHSGQKEGTPTSHAITVNREKKKKRREREKNGKKGPKYSKFLINLGKLSWNFKLSYIQDLSLLLFSCFWNNFLFVCCFLFTHGIKSNIIWYGNNS